MSMDSTFVCRCHNRNASKDFPGTFMRDWLYGDGKKVGYTLECVVCLQKAIYAEAVEKDGRLQPPEWMKVIMSLRPHRFSVEATYEPAKKTQDANLGSGIKK